MDSQSAGPLAHLLARTPRRADRVVFIGRSDGRFSGNVKYLFLHFLAHVPQCKSTFVTLNVDVYHVLRGAGLPTLLFPQPIAIQALAEAAVIVVDDFQFRENGIALPALGAKIVQLWHGVGFKKIGFLEIASALGLPPERQAHLTAMYSKYDAVVSTSPFYTEHLFQTSFGAKEIWEVGYPRNDVLLRKCTKTDLLGCDIDAYARLRALRKRFKTCLYAPTFRDDFRDLFTDGALDIGSFSEFLQREGIVLGVKMHPLCPDWPFGDVPHLLPIAKDSDIYPLFPLFDAILTDYSSIYMDYLHLHRPVLFFPYDRTDYNSRLREFQFDYDTMTPGPKAYTQGELQQQLREVLHGADAFAKDREALLRLAFSHNDANASARTATEIMRLASDIPSPRRPRRLGL